MQADLLVDNVKRATLEDKRKGGIVPSPEIVQPSESLDMVIDQQMGGPGPYTYDVTPWLHAELHVMYCLHFAPFAD